MKVSVWVYVVGRCVGVGGVARRFDLIDGMWVCVWRGGGGCMTVCLFLGVGVRPCGYVCVCLCVYVCVCVGGGGQV